MQASKANFFTKSEKRSRFDDENWSRNARSAVKTREKMDKNKQERRQANRVQEKDE